MLALLLALQIFHVAFLALHDWVPLGRLNDVRAVRQENPGSKLLVATFLSTVLFVPPLVVGLMHVDGQAHRAQLYATVSNTTAARMMSYGSGLQPSNVSCDRYLGLRPRLVCVAPSALGRGHGTARDRAAGSVSFQ